MLKIKYICFSPRLKKPPDPKIPSHWLTDDSFLTFGSSPNSQNSQGRLSQMDMMDSFCGVCSDSKCNDCSDPICGYTSGINLKNARLIANTCTKLSVIMLDSGASLACTPFEEDFEKLTLIKGDEKVIKGIAKGLTVKGVGLVPYALKANDGSDIVLLTKAYYVPEMPQRLVSPQSCCTIQGNPVKFSTFSSYQNKPGFARLEIYPKSENWHELTPLQSRHMPLHKRNNLPYLQVSTRQGRIDVAEALQAASDITSESNSNLTSSQKELLQWHFRLGHTSFSQLQWLARVGKLPCRNPHGVSNCKIPVCASCQFGKQCRRPSGAKTSIRHQDKYMEIKKGDLFPGDKVSVDHYQSAVPGRDYKSRGSPPPQEMLNGGSIFVDHASGRIFIHHQVSLNAVESIKAKLALDREAALSGISVHSIHTDNGVFSSKQYMAHLASKGQTVTFSGSGAAHQNAVAERAIKTVVYMARTMLIHAAMRSPENTITPDLWPMAMDYAAWIYNHLPKSDTGLSPDEIWTRSQFTPTKDVLARCHVWGAPTYVLEPKLQKSGIKIPKWAPRSRRGAFMGFSPHHSTLVPRVLNFTTGSITPQFHVVFDDSFSSVHSSSLKNTSIWNQLLSSPNARFQIDLDESDDQMLADEWLTSEEATARDLQQREEAHDALARSQITEGLQEQNQVENAHDYPIESQTPSETIQPQIDGTVNDPNEITQESSAESQEPDFQTTEDVVEQNHRYPRRDRKAPTNYTSDFGPAREWKGDQMINLCEALEGGNLSDIELAELYALVALKDSEESFINTTYKNDSEMAMAAKSGANDPDLPSLIEALSGPYANEWREAMTEEIKALLDRNTWTVIEKSELPSNAKVVPSTWAFRIKRFPNGDFRKFKARFCVRGDLQKKSVNDIQTYSPVAQWASVRLFLLLSIVLNLKTRSIDFSNAFAQAEIKGEPVYISIPPKMPGFSSGTVLKLNKSLYGQVDAPKMWYDKLKAGLEARGMKPCQADPCMFVSDKAICIIYVDDVLWAAKDDKTIDDILQSFKDDGNKFNWEMTESLSLEEYLGLKVKRLDQGYELTQPGLITKILEATGMQECRTTACPTTSSGPLGYDKHGLPPMYQDKWKYSSIIGMLLYLCNSRPDIAFAVHQCARFTHNPKRSHEKAVLQICRYLQGTKDKGLILKPTKSLSLECYADADFAGLYGVEDHQDPICVKSRTGYVITFASCPLLFVSKLQTEVALSTLHAEYVALSQSLRDLLPLKSLITEVFSRLKIDISKMTVTSKSTVYEDNNGARIVATCPRLTPTSKFIATKYHWFRQHVDSGEIEIKRVDSKNQLADIFTKGLQGNLFVEIRKLLCGW